MKEEARDGAPKDEVNESAHLIVEGVMKGAGMTGVEKKNAVGHRVRLSNLTKAPIQKKIPGVIISRCAARKILVVARRQNRLMWTKVRRKEKRMTLVVGNQGVIENGANDLETTRSPPVVTAITADIEVATEIVSETIMTGIETEIAMKTDDMMTTNEKVIEEDLLVVILKKDHLVMINMAADQTTMGQGTAMGRHRQINGVVAVPRQINGTIKVLHLTAVVHLHLIAETIVVHRHLIGTVEVHLHLITEAIVVLCHLIETVEAHLHWITEMIVAHLHLIGTVEAHLHRITETIGVVLQMIGTVEVHQMITEAIVVVLQMIVVVLLICHESEVLQLIASTDLVIEDLLLQAIVAVHHTATNGLLLERNDASVLLGVDDVTKESRYYCCLKTTVSPTHFSKDLMKASQLPFLSWRQRVTLVR